MSIGQTMPLTYLIDEHFGWTMPNHSESLGKRQGQWNCDWKTLKPQSFTKLANYMLSLNMYYEIRSHHVDCCVLVFVFFSFCFSFHFVQFHSREQIGANMTQIYTHSVQHQYACDGRSARLRKSQQDSTTSEHLNLAS